MSTTAYGSSNPAPTTTVNNVFNVGTGLSGGRSLWDYDYYLKMRRLQTPRRGHVVVYFENNLVARVDSDVKSAPLSTFSSKGVAAPEPHNARY